MPPNFACSSRTGCRWKPVEYLDETDDGKIIGEFRPSSLRPYTLEKARQFGFDQAYLEACL